MEECAKGVKKDICSLKIVVKLLYLVVSASTHKTQANAHNAVLI